MVTVPIEKVDEATKRVSRYHIKLEYSPANIVHEGEVDETNLSLSLRMDYIKDKLYSADFHRVKDAAYGKRSDTEQWQKIRVSGEFPKYLQSALGILKRGRITSTVTADQLLRADVEINDIPPLKNPEQFYSTVLKDAGLYNERLLKKMVELSQDISVAAHVWVHPENYQVKKINIQVRSSRINSEMTATFSQSSSEIPVLKAEKMGSNQEIPLSGLMFRMHSVGGWSELNHCTWSQRSIDMIKESDREMKYSEIYKGRYDINKGDSYGWYDKVFKGSLWVKKDSVYEPNPEYRPDENIHHPIIIGAYFEDQKRMPDFYRVWFDSDPHYRVDNNYYFKYSESGKQYYYRDFMHFGGEDTGLEYQSWFETAKLVGRDPPPTQLPGDRYLSAKNWGFGADPGNNRLTFPEAIRQYNRYSIEGKRNAYLILGHVLHLFQDVGNPDHANLEIHPGSTFDEAEAYDGMYVCTGVAVEAAAAGCGACLLACLVCSPIAGSIAYAACKNSIDSNEVGYERLIAESWKLARVEAQIKAIGITEKDNYNDYFKYLADLGKREASRLNLKSPLGLGNLKFPFYGVYPSGFDPNIDKTKLGETTPYLELTDKIVPNVICLGSGFIKYFYEIVNYPPYVERVAIVSTVPGQNPRAFARFDDALYVKDDRYPLKKYDSRWVPESGEIIPTLDPECQNIKDEIKSIEADERAPLQEALKKAAPDQKPGLASQINKLNADIQKKTRELEKCRLLHPDRGKARNRVIEINEPLNPYHQAYIFIRFGPTIGPEKSKIMREETLTLRLVGSSQPIDVRLIHGDDESGRYYWGSFKPPVLQNGYSLTMEISGRDASAHLNRRSQPGDVIDSNPATIPYADSNSPPLYPFKFYEPGVDRNHVISIGSSVNGTITGIVTKISSGQPIAGAIVTAGSERKTTDAAGHYSIDIAPGTYSVTASIAGFGSSTTGVTVSSGATITQNFGLAQPPPPAPGSIKGTVTNSDGTTIDGATVAAGYISTKTDSAGKYTLSNVSSGLQQVRASATGYNPSTKSATVIPGQSIIVDFKLAEKLEPDCPGPRPRGGCTAAKPTNLPCRAGRPSDS